MREDEVIQARRRRSAELGEIGELLAAHPVVLQPDGQILVSGSFTSFDGFPWANLVRLNGDAKTLRLGPLSMTRDGAASLTVFPGGQPLESIEIQTATQFSTPDWQPVAGKWQAVGSLDAYRFPVSADPQRFYRAVGR